MAGRVVVPEAGTSFTIDGIDDGDTVFESAVREPGQFPCHCPLLDSASVLPVVGLRTSDNR